MDEKKDQLQTDLLFINNELQAERQKGAEGDAAKITQLEQRRADVQYELDGINKAAKEQAIEERVHSEITFAIPGVDFTQLPVELISVIQLVVKADRRKSFAEHATELEKIEQEAEAKIQAAEDSSAYLTAHNDELKKIIENGKADNARLIRENGELRDYTYQLNLEKEDKDTKLANAVTQLEEAKAEIARLESQVEDYQKAKVLGERQAQAVIDVTPTEADEINAAIKQLFVKSENWGSVEKLYLPDGTFKVVKRDELADWTAITPPPLLGGSETLAETFQDEVAEANATDSGISAPQAPLLDFRSQEESNGGGLPVDENGTLRSDDAPATWGELKALEAKIERRLSWLEQQTAVVA